MNRSSITLLSTILIFFFACKPDSSEVISPKKVDSSTIIAKNKESGNKIEHEVNIPGLRAQALSILNFRLKNFPKTYAIIDHNLWEYKFVFDGEISPPGKYDNVWIDFKEDHTYEYGFKDKINGTGRYNYHLDRGELVMVDNDKTKKPEEYTVKISADVMVLQGTSSYGDRHIQMKLENVTEAIKSSK